MIEDTRQPEFQDHSACDKCGAIYDNSDLNELRGDRWYCDDCNEEIKREEKQQWTDIKKFISATEEAIDKINETYYTLKDDELDNLCDLFEQAWSIVNKLT